MITTLLIVWAVGVAVFLPGITYLAVVGNPKESFGTNLTGAIIFTLIWPLFFASQWLKSIIQITFPWWFAPHQLRKSNHVTVNAADPSEALAKIDREAERRNRRSANR